jgi:hypothetical protein
LLSGINIDNYIHNLEYTNNIIVNNINLYKKSLSSFHNYHISFLSNLNNKLNCMSEQLDNDVNFTHAVKDKPNIVITKICKKCEKNDAEYCGICMYEETDQNNKLNNLRNTIVEPDPEFNLDSDSEPIPEPVAELVIEPVAEQIPDPEPIQVIEPVAEPVPEPVPEPILEPVAEPVPEPVPEPMLEPVAEPVPEPIPKPVPEPVPEPILEPVAEPVPEPIPEPVPEPVPEPIPEPVPEPEGMNLYNSVVETSINTNELSLSTIYESEEEALIPDIKTDNKTNTDDIERKIRNNPPLYLDLNLIPKNELSHPKNELNHDKKKHKNKNKNKK